MFDAFLKIDGIDGESTDDKHKGWIEVLSYGWGVQQPASASGSSGGGASSQRANFSDFMITKALDKASPKVALASCKGTHIKSIVLELCRAGGDKVKYMEYKLSESIISSVQTGGAPQGAETLPTETLSFNFGKIEWTYSQQKRADGSGGGQVAASWDLATNKGA